MRYGGHQKLPAAVPQRRFRTGAAPAIQFWKGEAGRTGDDRPAGAGSGGERAGDRPDRSDGGLWPGQSERPADTPVVPGRSDDGLLWAEGAKTRPRHSKTGTADVFLPSDDRGGYGALWPDCE